MVSQSEVDEAAFTIAASPTRTTFGNFGQVSMMAVKSASRGNV